MIVGNMVVDERELENTEAVDVLGGSVIVLQLVGPWESPYQLVL